jgi:hypothetical protein
VRREAPRYSTGARALRRAELRARAESGLKTPDRLDSGLWIANNAVCMYIHSFVS